MPHLNVKIAKGGVTQDQKDRIAKRVMQVLVDVLGEDQLTTVVIDEIETEGVLLKISKASRHSKITGDFGETLVLYWLSKYGFECAPVDHTGIDIIARNPCTDEIMGISVKSRCRRKGSEDEYLNIPNDNFEKVEKACAAFCCVPYFAIVVDAGDILRAFILPMDRLLELFPKGKRASGWKMTESHLDSYAEDSDIMSFEFRSKTTRWWSQPDTVSICPKL
jgi:4-oxalocrotonate tautomerase family enzyme